MNENRLSAKYDPQTYNNAWDGSFGRGTIPGN